ncbi:MAG: hypothetical protein IDH49_15025 [Gammaproteobacteria bacterium]|nr:hypothetical protein [Gammaproteobacteria bacterium]
MKSGFLVMSITMMVLAGCNVAGFRYHEIHERYQKLGAKEKDVVKAMLECGMVDPFGHLRLETGRSYQEEVENTAYGEACMFNDGFKLAPGYRGSMCEGNPNRQACKPENAHLIPKRDINRRLNSHYCKAYPKARACQP